MFQEKLNQILKDLKEFANSNLEVLSKDEISKIISLRSNIKNLLRTETRNVGSFLCLECNEFGINPFDDYEYIGTLEECYSFAQKNSFDVFVIYEIIDGRVREIVGPEW